MGQYNFVDIHCHILPGVDDGAADIAQTQKMLRMAAAEGICEIVTTPHYKMGRNRRNASKERIAELVQELQRWLADEGINIQLYTGNEILYSYEIDHLLEAQAVCTLADSSYVLVEFSPGDEFTYIKNGVQKILMAGFVPVVAHIERYEVLRKRQEYVEELVEMGAYMQVNASSIIGKAGWSVKRCVVRWIRDELVHIIASDAHDDKKRAPIMNKAAQIVERKFGVHKVMNLFYKNPKAILQGKTAQEYMMVG